MFTSFSTALSGLSAMTDAIDVVGNNLANLNTTGYKNNTVQFSELISEALGGSASTQVGLGTSRPDTLRQFTQGSIQTTGNDYDAAIQGDGFFVVKGTDGQQAFTRDGEFKVDENGILETSSGEHVQGWSSDSNGALTTNGVIGDIQVPVGATLQPRATSSFSVDGNLNSSGVAGSSTGTFATQAIQAVDSLGNTVPLTLTFTKDTATTGKWSYQVTSSEGTVAGGTGTLQFDSTGTLTSVTSSTLTSDGKSDAMKISGLTDGASDLSMNWNFYNTDGSAKFTQYSETSALSANTQNGQAAAQLTAVSLGDNGQVLAKYSDGTQEVAAQLAIANIRNPDSLLGGADNTLLLGAGTAAPTIGVAGTGGRGTIEGGAVESSTVDIASQFSDLLVYQRSYQANSRVITVSDEISQETVNLIK